MKKIVSLLILILMMVLGMSSTPAHAQIGTSGDPFTSLAEAYAVPSSGRYYFLIDGYLFKADVDTSEGGGWVLVLQYNHKAGTNPALSVKAPGTSFPITSTPALGTDESSSSDKWGHAGNAAMSLFSGDIETRWYAETSRDSNAKIHFYSTIGDDYFRTGSGNVNGINSNHTLLTGHNANLPASAASYFSNKGDLAFTDFPYWRSNQYHWGIRGVGDRWEVDDYALNAYHTMHKVWVRETPDFVDVPDATYTCRSTDGVNRTTPSIYWDTEPHDAPGGLRNNYVPGIIASASNTVNGLGMPTSNTASNRQFLENIEATNLDEARRNKEYLEQSFTVQSDYAAYIDKFNNYILTTDGLGIDIATSSDFSDAVNVYDGPSATPTSGWEDYAPDHRFILSPGQTYYIRFYFYGADSTQETLDAWGMALGSCMDFGDAPIDSRAFQIQFGNTYLGAIAGDQDASSHLASGEGDDDTATDDEDGVTLPTLTSGTTQTISANIVGSGTLQAWVDFNGNGDFSDSGEQIATDIQDNGAGDTNASAGVIGLSVDIPTDAILTPTFARFIWSTTSGLESDTMTGDGEIEDYAITILDGGELEATKTVQVWDPTSSGLFFLPGNDVIYSIAVSNVGAGSVDNNTIIIIDKIPDEVTFYNKDIDGGGPETQPVSFADTGSGLTFNYATDVAYSNSVLTPANFSECNYTPDPDYDAAVTHICINPKGNMNSGATTSSFVVSFRARIK